MTKLLFRILSTKAGRQLIFSRIRNEANTLVVEGRPLLTLAALLSRSLPVRGRTMLSSSSTQALGAPGPEARA